jgi:hypothetical protein
MERYHLIVIGGGSGGLTVAAIALSLAKLTSAIQVFPALSEVRRSLGDLYLQQRTAPRLRRFLGPIFAYLRRAIR